LAPNYKLVPVETSVEVLDSLSPPGYTLLWAASSEPDRGLGDGDLPNDIEGRRREADMSGEPWAERSGRGDGRVFTPTWGWMRPATRLPARRDSPCRTIAADHRAA